MSTIIDRKRKMIYTCSCVFIFLFSIYCYMGDKSGPEVDDANCDLRLWINNTETTDNADISLKNDYKATSGFHCLMKCPIKLNCFYENDLQNKIARADLKHNCILILDSERIEYFKNTQPSFRHQLKHMGYNMLRATNLSNILTLKLLNGCNDIKKIATKPRKFCDKNCTKTNIILETNESDPMMSLKLMKTIDNVDSVATIVFNDIPTCLVIVNSIRKIIWSDNKRGIIQILDLDKSTQNILVSKLTMPGSISIDPNRGYLFWCNYELEGSIERVDLIGGNRIDITKEKYNLSYPTNLVIDQYSRKLYWSTNNVTHISDFNGNNHAILQDQTFLEENRHDCINFHEKKEHNIFWGKKSIGDHVPSVLSNFLLSITHVEKNDTSYKILRNNCTVDYGKCTHTCLRNLEGYHCVCLKNDDKNCPLDNQDYFISKTLSSIGFLPMSDYHIPGIDKNVLEDVGNSPFDYNLKTQRLFYYSMAFKQIRVVNMSLKSKTHSILFDKITLPNDGLAYDWITNNLYFIDVDEQNIKVVELDYYHPEIILNFEENSSLNGLVIHPRKSILFFIRQISMKKILYKFLLDGKNVSIVTEMNAGSTDYVIIDPDKNSIFWFNIITNSINKIDFYGNHRETYSSSELYSYIIRLNEYYALTNSWNDDAVAVNHFNLKEKRIEKINYAGRIKKCIHESKDIFSEWNLFLLYFVPPLFMLSTPLTCITLYASKPIDIMHHREMISYESIKEKQNTYP